MADEQTDGSGESAAVEGPQAKDAGIEQKAPPAESQAKGGRGKPKDRAAKAKSKAEPKSEASSEVRANRRGRGRSMRGRSRRHKANLEKVDRDKQHPVDEGLKLLKDVAGGTKFKQTVNLVMHLGIDPRQADQMIRGSVSLPKGIGKTKRVIAFCEGDDAEKATAAGAIEAGIDELVKKISGGWMEFDVAIAHPRSMGKVGKLGRVLGPQGKMPSPKNGTVTPDVETAVREFAAGKVEFRNDAGGNIHAVVGTADFSNEDLKENIQSFIGHIRKMKPAASKGTFIKKICISGSMSPAIQLEVAHQ